jgi:hypothetical protein
MILKQTGFTTRKGQLSNTLSAPRNRAPRPIDSPASLD